MKSRPRSTSAIFLLLIAATSCGSVAEAEVSDEANANRLQSVTDLQPASEDGSTDLGRICDKVWADLQGDMSDEELEFIMEEVGVSASKPIFAESGDSVSLDNAEICLAEIEGVLMDEFGITMATFERTRSTRALDGEKSADGDGWTIYWTYHPDDGLDLILERQP